MDNNNINNVYEIESWEDAKLNLKDKLLRGIYSFGFENPSPIQRKGLFSFIKNKYKGRSRDIIAQAQSGTGKTGLFVVGSLQMIDDESTEPQIIILAPTHELAEQTYNVATSLSTYLKIKSCLLVGGTPIHKNKKVLTDDKPQLIIGTPGRIHDMMRRKILKVDNVKSIVIDEADEMLSQGFKEQMYKIFHFLNNDVQIGLFSATMPEELNGMIDQIMQSPTKILVKAENLTLQGIAQYYINIHDDAMKYETLKDIFQSLSISQAMIYCNSVSRVNDLEEAMTQDNFPVKKIHGKMLDKERKEIFKEFKSGGCRVLITSDLFSRGIDVQQVSIVINFDIPRNENTYLHRIGRSGRWGRKGIAINFQTKYDSNRLTKFANYYQTEIKELPSDYTKHIEM
tara:strand:- start:1823 stop:3016 length:1194 start_codon:yes stop_codon:yes gene_type:complete